MSLQSPRDSLQLFLSCFSFPGILFFWHVESRGLWLCVSALQALSRVGMVFGGVFQGRTVSLYPDSISFRGEFRSKMGLGQVL